MRLTEQIKKEIINKIVEDIPQENFDEQAHNLLKAEYEKLVPAHIRKLVAKDKDRLRYGFVSYSRSNPWRSVSATVMGHDDVTDVLPDTVKPLLDDLLLKAQEQEDKLRDIKKKLFVAFSNIRSLKRAKEIFPEFEKYFPAPEESPKYLPVHTNVVVSLMDAGWPKNKPKKKRSVAQ